MSHNLAEETIERRQIPRISVDYLVTFTCQGKVYKSKIRNISRFGAFISIDNPPPLDINLILEFVIPRFGIVLARGHVAWSKKRDYLSYYGMGVIFDVIDDE